MNALEHLNRIAMAHDQHPDAPVRITASVPLSDYDYPGVMVIGDSLDAFDEDLAGAPNGALVCYGADRVSAVLRAELVKRDGEGRQTGVVVIPVKEPGVRRALGKDVAALLHIQYSEIASTL